MKLEEFIEFAERYKNWGRWGADDEAGTLNFVTPQHVVDACRLVREGRIFPLAIPFDEHGPQRPRPDSPPYELSSGIVGDPRVTSSNHLSTLQLMT